MMQNGLNHTKIMAHKRQIKINSKHTYILNILFTFILNLYSEINT